MAALMVTVEKAILETYISGGASDANSFVLSFSAADFGTPAHAGDISSDSTKPVELDWRSLTSAQKKQLQFQASVSLPGMSLSGLGSLGLVGKTMTRLRSLDLQGNALTLQHAVDILQQLPQLQTLDLGKNRLEGQVPSTVLFTGSKLHTLALNASAVQPAAVGALVAHLPALRHLHVCANEWSDVQPFVTAAGSEVAVTQLFLGGNPIDSLSKCLSSLSTWGKLEHIDLAGTAFASSVSESAMASCSPPASLSSLGLDECNLASWAEVAAVGVLPLPSVRLRRTAVLQPVVQEFSSTQAAAGAGAAGVCDVQGGARGLYMPRAQACGEQSAEILLRQIMVALLPHTTLLNGSSVSGPDRVAAERFTLRYFGSWEEPETASAGISAEQAQEQGLLCDMWKPPNFVALRKMHGALGPLAVVDLGGPESVTMAVSYEWEVGANGGKGGSVGLPRSTLQEVQLKQTVGELKALLCKPLGDIPGAVMRCVLHADPEVHQQPWPHELRYDSLQVSTLRPSEGSALRVVVRGTG